MIRNTVNNLNVIEKGYLQPVDDAQESADLFDTLKRTGLKGRDVHYVIQSIRDMAAANLIARFESKLDSVNAQVAAQGESLAAKLEAQNSKFTWMQWVIGIGVGVLVSVGLAILAYLLSQPWA